VGLTSYVMIVIPLYPAENQTPIQDAIDGQMPIKQRRSASQQCFNACRHALKEPLTPTHCHEEANVPCDNVLMRLLRFVSLSDCRMYPSAPRALPSTPPLASPARTSAIHLYPILSAHARGRISQLQDVAAHGDAVEEPCVMGRRVRAEAKAEAQVGRESRAALCMSYIASIAAPGAVDTAITTERAITSVHRQAGDEARLCRIPPKG
jgi:hypothetical protein